MKERRGEKVSKMRLSLIMNSFMTEEDKNFLESEFLEKSAEFYATQNFKPLAPLTIPAYIEWVSIYFSWPIVFCFDSKFPGKLKSAFAFIGRKHHTKQL